MPASLKRNLRLLHEECLNDAPTDQEAAF